MKWNVGTKISAGFGLAVALFVIVGAVSYRSTTSLIDAAQWNTHTYEVLGHLDAMLSALKDVEAGQRGFIIAGEDAYLDPYRSAIARIPQELAVLRSLTKDNSAQEKRLDRLEPLIAARLAVAAQAVSIRRARGLEAAANYTRAANGRELMDGVRATVGEARAEEETLLKERTAVAEESARNTKQLIALGTTLAVILAVLAALLLTHNIAGPLQSLTSAAEQIAVGQLSVSIAGLDRNDEVGVLASSFDRMTQSLRTMAATAERIAAGDLRVTVTPHSDRDILGVSFMKMIDTLRDQMRRLSEGANVLGASASEIVASTAQLAASATQSAAAVSETTTTVEEVRQTAQVASQKARYVSENAQNAAQISQGGRKSADDVTSGMQRIRQQMDAIAMSMVRLTEQSQAIGQIIATVEDLASQSNLLAVNAAIKAAEAGEHGKGFGVVALEVRSLAEQSRQATGQVRTILGEIQKATTAAVLATEQGSKVVEAGLHHTEVASEAIQALTSSIGEAAQAATQIAASSQQQQIGVDQVALAMESIKQGSSQNVASARQLEMAARNLNDLGYRLKTIVDRYRVEPSAA